MLAAHPLVLRKLLDRYTSLRSLATEQRTAESRRRLDDVTYTLCVSTGTRSIEAALAVAQARLAESTPQPSQGTTPGSGAAETSAILTV